MGVPQGSVFSVTLFSIKMNDIVKNIISEKNSALFMDGFFLSYRAKHEPHRRKLKICPDKIHKWTTENGLKFSKE